MRHSSRPLNLLVIWLWMLCAAGAGAARANESVGELDLKAAYIFNFIQFIEWPYTDASKGNELTLCVSPFSRLIRPLTALEGKQASKGRTVRVKFLETGGVRNCQVLVLQNADLEQVLRTLQTLPPAHGILTISDDVTFANPDIVITLTQQEGRVVFGISTDAAAKAGLVVSSRLLRLAKVGR